MFVSSSLSGPDVHIFSLKLLLLLIMTVVSMTDTRVLLGNTLINGFDACIVLGDLGVCVPCIEE